MSELKDPKEQTFFSGNPPAVNWGTVEVCLDHRHTISDHIILLEALRAIGVMYVDIKTPSDKQPGEQVFEFGRGGAITGVTGIGTWDPNTLRTVNGEQGQ